MRPKDTIRLKATLNRIAADEGWSWQEYLGYGGAAGIAVGVIWLLVNRYTSCGKAIADALKEAGMTADTLRSLWEDYVDYRCKARNNAPRGIVKEDALKFKAIIEKLVQLKNCKGAILFDTLKELLGKSFSPGQEGELRGALDRWSQDAGDAAGLAAILLSIYGAIKCTASTCVTYSVYFEHLRHKYLGATDEVLEYIAYILAAIVAVKVLIATAPVAATAAAAAALLATYQTALASELERAGIVEQGQGAAEVDTLLSEVEPLKCQEATEDVSDTSDTQTTDPQGPPPSGNLLENGDIEGVNDIKGVD
jgi:hypothetical protein